MKENKKLKTENFDGVVRIKNKENILPSYSLVKSGLKLTSAAVFSFLLLMSVSSVGGTVSYFSDSEGAMGNYFRADPISFKVDTATNQIDLSEEKKIELVMTPDEVSDPIQYFVSSRVISGNEEFCSRINILGTDPFSVATKLSSLSTDVSTTTGLWTITLNVPDELKVPGYSCQVELNYLGWNAGSELGKSFTDTKKIILLFFIPSTYKSLQVESISSEIVTPTIDETSQESVVEEITTEEDTSGSVEDKKEIMESDPTPTPTITPTPEVTPTVEPVVTSTPVEETPQVDSQEPSQLEI